MLQQGMVCPVMSMCLAAGVGQVNLMCRDCSFGGIWQALVDKTAETSLKRHIDWSYADCLKVLLAATSAARCLANQEMIYVR